MAKVHENRSQITIGVISEQCDRFVENVDVD